MLRLFFYDLWSNMKRSPIVSLLIFIQIAILSFCITDIFFEKISSDFNNDAYTGVYLDNTLFSIRIFNADREEVARASAGMFESLENSGLEDYEAFHKIIMGSDDIKTAVMTGTGTNSRYYSVDKDYINIFGLVMDSGRVFTDEEYENIDFERIPVILGYDYKDEYSIGETFEAPHIALGRDDSAKCTYEVIGFIAKGQIYFDPGGSGPFLFDGKMILPYYTKSLADWLDFYEKNSEFLHKKTVIRYYIAGLGANAISGRHYLIESGKEDVLVDYVNNALSETGLIDYYKIGSSFRSAVLQTGDELVEKNTIYTVLTVIIVLFALASVVFSSVNNVSNNMKTYAIHNLVGATRIRIILYGVGETFIYCVLGFSAGFLWRYVFSYIQMKLTDHPAMSATVLSCLFLAALFTVLSCALAFVFIYIRVREYSTSELIRGREVKKNGRQSFYKIMYFTMMAFVAVSITFLNSYSYQVEHIDRYQNNYWPKKGTVLYLHSLADQNSLLPELDYDLDGFNDYSVEICLEINYNEHLNPKLRGWFYKGDFGVPEVTDGRFFSSEEISQISNYAVAGKNVIANFCSERDGKRYITYKDNEYEVIGTVGREGHETSLDDWVFLTLPTVIERFGAGGHPVIVDAKNASTQQQIIDYLKSAADGRYTYMEQPVSASIDIGIRDDIINIFIAVIIITAVIFCIFFTDKLKQTINIKKFVGYSVTMISADTSALFVSISAAAFLIGNLIMYAVSKTLLKEIPLFAVYSINIQVLLLSFGILILFALFLSLFAIYRSFRGTARDLKKS